MKVVTTEGCEYLFNVTDLKATFTVTLPPGQTSRKTVRTKKAKIYSKDIDAVLPLIPKDMLLFINVFKESVMRMQIQ